MQSALSELIPILQTAISPMILISSTGLILLSMTNRLGRTIDRSRILSAELARCAEKDRSKIQAQIHLIWRRAKLIRFSILLTSASALSAAILILTLFLAAWMKLSLDWLVTGLFVGCLVCLIGSLLIFAHDINLSLGALKVELGETDIQRIHV